MRNVWPIAKGLSEPAISKVVMRMIGRSGAELFAGFIVSREAIRLWCIKFGALYARRLKRRQQGYGDTFYIDVE